MRASWQFDEIRSPESEFGTGQSAVAVSGARPDQLSTVGGGIPSAVGKCGL